MDILDIIRKRRSIREYKKDMPKDTEIEKILESGRWAPSGLNNQPWRFLVIKEKGKKDGLGKFTKPEYADTIRNAPVVLIVCMDNADSYNRDKDLMAIGACIENILLTAHTTGIATCWMGEIINQKEKLAKYLKFDEDLEIMAVIALGYSDEDIAEGCRKPLSGLMIE
ncbi:MAG: hypothetical protein A2Y00_10220 [Omnitrophica WOR_2 bacterium GWF2_43_52]|nr:MAG: hypothetical protein A2Y01_02395 [Omnitrophica WOR_2 bacterium GWC2_44_8]OGX21605.1 MAG: hypothetical protein A2Y00_10220 [Omnitrophica WOR_2 bacterium GWF2_43_52]OGX59115.1 MAG: hypothetical protein A2460_09460 [Omnitrophica WOR_2 bacterium RIFOXYC2_FULL_43_9]HAH20329.1 nitroreductase family protein [Candidatus Omnitrophota bacterium]HBG63863.1 nitroreductase family protein [Candidatus Omnitrophota bacterium]